MFLRKKIIRITMEIGKVQSILIRGVAIIMIVFYHFQYDMFGGSFLMERGQGMIAWIADSFAYIQQEPNAWIGFLMYFCFIGVNIFFVLSGYGLVKKYKDRGILKMEDMLKQSMKILIPYWLAHPIIHVLDWGLKTLQYQFGFIEYKTYFLGMHSFSQYIESFLVFPRWFNLEGALTFVGTWWFVGIIIQFYLLFPFLLKLFKKLKPIRALAVCVTISFVYRYIISVATGSSPVGINEADIFLFIMFPAKLSEFALGMYLALELESIKLKNGTLISIPLIILGFIFLGNVQTMFISDFLFAFGGVMLVYTITKPLKGFTQKAIFAIGEKSYLIYLYHEPTMKLILKFIFPNWIH
jgi:peptidoglycan/LPS O-acetylase OafA/YrhL